MAREVQGPFFVICWDTNQPLQGPIDDFKKAKKACRNYGHAIEPIQRGFTGYSPIAFVGVPTEHSDGTKNWGLVYNPRFDYPPQ